MPKILTTDWAVLLALAPGQLIGECDRCEQTIKFAHVVVATGPPKGKAAIAFAYKANSEKNGPFCLKV